MRSLARVLPLFVLICMSAGDVYANPIIIFSNFGPSDEYNLISSWGISNDLHRAMPFTVPAGADVRVGRYDVALNATSNVIVSFALKTDDNGKPGNMIDDFSINNVGSTSIYSSNSTGKPTLSANTRYWLEASTSGTAVCGWNWSQAPWQTYGVATLTSSLPWNVDWGDYSGAFRVATPEPSTLVLLVGGGISLLAYAWRRKRRT